jgi:mRNA interferase RelE/StbE
MKKYSIILHPLAAVELKDLDGSVQKYIIKQIKKLESYPYLGELLGNKHGYDLAGYRKLYASNKKIRIVYTIQEELILVQIIAIGRREGLEVYEDASNRI